MIQDPNSLFMTRLEDYYWVRHVDNTPFKTRFYIFDMEVIEHIRDNIEFEKGNSKEFYNLWVAYFNGNKNYIKGDLISKIKHFEFMDNLNCFYGLVVTIYILEKYIKDLLAK